ncbi:unnamed protein product [Ilex paraguariensis]|uniref:Uncharacterized protein n=1 Tax=Ilex paraguariensis TaxID=185542 RepID=A0ABC8R163_9AQUA
MNMSSSTHDIKTELDIERPGEQVQSPPENFRQITSNKWSPRSSLPLDIDRTICFEQNGKEFDTASAEYIQRLMLLTSNARSSHCQDDEAVDLTEPRFESFSMANVRSTI